MSDPVRVRTTGMDNRQNKRDKKNIDPGGDNAKALATNQTQRKDDG